MKILVTGAAGFIGFHLVKALTNIGNEVVGIDNINDYYDVNLKYARLKETGINRELITENKELIKSTINSNFQFAKIDITDLKSLEELFEKEQFTHVINLAAQAGVRYSLENPHTYIQSNIVGFVNILECCRNYKIKHFVYASSSSVYGANAKIPFSESERCDNPVSLYAATKRANEMLAFTYNHLFDINSIGLRFFTVYGPWGRPDMAPILFAKAAFEGKPIKVFNHGNQMRDFTYIDDIINGIIALFKKKEDVVKGAQVCNIGNGNPVDLIEFIHAIEKETGIELRKEYTDAQPGDVAVTYADTSKLSKEVDYKPKVNIAEGVKKFINWYKKYENIN